MTKEQAKREMDAIVHGPMGLRTSFKPEERKRLDVLRSIAFADELAPTRGVKLDGKDFEPTARQPLQDFLPDEAARVMTEPNPTLRMNAARALRGRVMSATAMGSQHPYWDAAAGDHEAWQYAMAQITRIALSEDK